MAPAIPSQNCQMHESKINELIKNQQEIAEEVDSIRKAFVTEIGTSPDLLNAANPNGTGLKGLLCQVIEKIDALDKRVDELTKSVPSTTPAATESIVKKVSYWLLILYLAVQQMPVVYGSINGSVPAHPISSPASSR